MVSSFAARGVPFAAVVALAVACATNPVTGKKEVSLMSEAQEVQLGREYDAEIRQQMRPYDDPALQEYVQRLGQNLARLSHRPDLPWTFTVVDVPAVNAFALPGGYIYITRGILAFLEDEAELAGVLGHEIGHVTARHAAQQYTKATTGQIGLAALGIFVPAARPFGSIAETGLALLFLKHGRDDELQSDRLGVEYAAKAGFDPRGVPDFLSTLARLGETTDRSGVPNWLSTHPEPADRVEKIQAAVTAQPQATYARNREQHLQRVDGIVFGDNPEDGLVRGDAFIHPVMRFAMRFPRDWEIANSATQVVAHRPNANHYVLLQLEQQPQGRNVEEVALTGMQRRGLQPLEGAATRINGLDAFVGLYRGQIQGLGDVGLRAAHIVHGRSVFLVVGLAPADGFSAVDDEFVETIRSFRPIGAAEAEDVRPNRVDLYQVRPGDTWEAIAARAGEGTVKPETLALMNGRSPSEPPSPGERIKIVVAG